MKFGSLKTISCYNEGLLLCFSEVTDKDGLLSLRSICDTQITISCNNVSKGSVFCVDFMDCTDDEIANELPEGVALLRRLPSGRNRSVLKSGRLLLEFPSSVAPPHLILNCNLRLEVRAHIPAPLRCRNCFEFGHHERVCDVEEARCGRCGQLGHPADTCPAEAPHCHACGLCHDISSPECKVWRKEMSINIVRFQQGVSSSKARQIVNNTNVRRPVAPVPTPLQTCESTGPSMQPCPSQSEVSYARITSPATHHLPSTNKEESSLAHTFENLICRQMELLESLVAQNATIIQQNQQIIKLLSTPKLKQSSITSALTRTASLSTLFDSQTKKRTADDSPPKEPQSKKQQRTQPPPRKDQKT